MQNSKFEGWSAVHCAYVLRAGRSEKETRSHNSVQISKLKVNVEILNVSV